MTSNLDIYRLPAVGDPACSSIISADRALIATWATQMLGWDIYGFTEIKAGHPLITWRKANDEQRDVPTMKLLDFSIGSLPIAHDPTLSIAAAMRFWAEMTEGGKLFTFPDIDHNVMVVERVYTENPDDPDGLDEPVNFTAWVATEIVRAVVAGKLGVRL